MRFEFFCADPERGVHIADMRSADDTEQPASLEFHYRIEPADIANATYAVLAAKTGVRLVALCVPIVLVVGVGQLFQGKADPTGMVTVLAVYAVAYALVFKLIPHMSVRKIAVGERTIRVSLTAAGVTFQGATTNSQTVWTGVSSLRRTRKGYAMQLTNRLTVWIPARALSVEQRDSLLAWMRWARVQVV